MSAPAATVRVQAGQTLLSGPDGAAHDLLPFSRTRLTRPFLKWTGGKQWLGALAPLLLPPDFSGRYYEPFLGGGSVFFALGTPRASISDANVELVHAYLGVQQCPEAVIDVLRTYPNDREFFLHMRAARPRALHTKAARIIYLNKTAFNGMYRVNLRGEFNVPFGRYTRNTICDADRIRAASEALQGVSIGVGDFQRRVARAESDDFVYLDPPYITGHRNNGFLKYNAPLFSWGDQQRLARTAMRLRDRGVHVVVSNSDHRDVTCLYEGFRRYVVERNSLIGGRGSTRGMTQEVLLTSSELLGAETERI